MIRFFLRFVACLFLGTFCSTALAASDLEKGFQTPPDTTKPGVYWYWINDNVSTEGVVKDLEAMHEVGIGRAFIGNIGEQGGDYGKVKLLSDPWWEATHAAMKTATRLGIEIGMFNSPGWSQSGGPWIKPERSMRYLAVSEVEVSGPKKFDGKLSAPGADFQDVKTIAFKAPKDDGIAKEFEVDMKAGRLELDLGSETTVRGIVLKTKVPAKGRLEILAKENETFRSVKTVNFDRSNPNLNVGFIPFAPVAISIPATTAKVFQLKFTEIHGGPKLEVAFRSSPLVESYAEKSLAKMWPTPLPMWDAYLWPEQPVVDDSNTVIPKDGVLDLSKHLKADGTLDWEVPEGTWIVQRTGMLTTGVQNAPATPEAKGLEVDKMSKKHVAFHFDAFLGKILERIPEADRKSFKVAVEDSYETGGQNWTDDFIAEFQKIYGYDPVPFLPVLSGRVVGSEDISDRFLWDLRRLIADKVAYDYVGGLREVANKHGLTTWLECYGHWGFPGEFLQYGGQSDGIAGEFWNEGSLGSIENRAASSCGHIYGKTKITAESFTAGGGVYERYPRLLKKRCDWSYTEGINESLLHLYIHQPYEDKTPGINAWFATEFNRKNTWFKQMKPFVDYMRRCMFLLQQGQNVADVAYFIGEDAPKMTGVCDPPLPKGYSFDYINGEIIRDKLTVKNNKLVLPHGTEYRLLVLPKLDTMRPETLAKIKSLVEQGAHVLGPAPKRSPSLQNYPACDVEVRRLAGELWGDAAGKMEGAWHNLGKGVVFSNLRIEDVFDVFLCSPDCVTDNPNTLYVHRKLSDGTEIYFLSNQVDKPITFSATFRVVGKQPELWDAVDGSMRPLPAFEQSDDQTTVPLELDAWGSAFVVFRKPGKPTATGLAANFPERKTLAALNGPWEVGFLSDELHRGPKGKQVFETLTDWTASDNDAVKYYSGPATYKTTFHLDAVPTGPITVELGNVQVVASVKVNGKEAGGVWTAPWRLDVTPLLQKGANTLEIEVVNTWINRLVGDAKLPEAERKTWITVNKFKPETPLKPSGLLGPVTLTRTQ